MNHQKVSKYYERDCVLNFLLLFISSLTTLILENSHIFARINFAIQKKRSRPNLKAFKLQWKDREGT